MHVIYRHGYSPDTDLGLFVGVTIKIGIDGGFYVEDGYRSLPFTDKIIEDGCLILLCPENY